MAATTPTRAPAGEAMAKWSAKALLIAAGITLVGGAIWYARAVTVPLIVAALVSTQLIPLVEAGTRRGVPRGLAITGAMLSVLVVVGGLTWIFADALFGQLGGVGDELSAGADEAITWLQANNDWVQQNEAEIRKFLDGLLPAAKEAAGGVVGGVLTGLSLAAQLVSAALLTFVFLLYLLTGGDQVWHWIERRFSTARRAQVTRAGDAAWNAAGGYIRGIALVALIDSVVISAGMFVFGTPLIGTLFLLSFVSLFIPILGAWVSGAVIVLVTLGAEGAGAALGMTAVILVAQQLDSMFVTPLVYQKTVSLHPIITLSGVIIGSQLLGIVGAFLAVPMIAIGWAVYNTLEQPESPPQPTAAPQSG
ncbi:MAG: AI-2E family transporter [Solirubrobacteraceae bacterium]|nr:AI-2E family transporter [Solirubrobacteraceae bacterium]